MLCGQNVEFLGAFAKLRKRLSFIMPVRPQRNNSAPTARIMQFNTWLSFEHTEWRKKCHTIDCARNTFLLLKTHLTSGTELILMGWKIVPNEEHVQCDHRFASGPT
jgi:hypothetical protein